MSCQCHQIGGPFIAEDPSCPVHGESAKSRSERVYEIMDQVRQETDVDRLRELAQQLADEATDIY